MPAEAKVDAFTPNPASMDGASDLTMLLHMREGNILHNLKFRYNQGEIATSVTSKVLVVVNPYEAVPGLDSTETMARYHRLPPDAEGIGGDDKQTGPSTFRVAHSAYSNLCLNLKNQSCIVCGESGAGKTESAKMIMRFLAFSSSANFANSQALFERADAVGKQVLDANPILESFGNAKTLLNDNSSRFAKFTKMLFEPTSSSAERMLVGASIETFLLERSRITKQSPGERNYHAFYYLATRHSQQLWPTLNVTDLTSFRYTNQSGCYFKRAGGGEDTSDLQELLRALDTVRLSKDEQAQVMSVLAGILHLGNVRFTSAAQGSRVVDADPLAQVARLTGVDEKKLERRLTHENLVVVGKKVEKTLEPNNAEINRDAIAKGMYNGLFSYLVGRVNQVSDVKQKSDLLWIGTLDVFGFEIFEDNSFEQFCINLCNERLQQYFNFHVLSAEQELYVKEGLLWEPVPLPDLQDCIELILSKAPPGILAILDSTCVQPKGDDRAFTANLFKSRQHPKLKKVTQIAGKSTGGKKININGFLVKHYAGDVVYNAEHFLSKNTDQTHPDTAALFISSSMLVARGIFSAEVRGDGKDDSKAKQRAFQSVGTRFGESLSSLIKTLDQTNPFFIRCIKPNSVKRPKQFDDEYVRPQLRCGGLVQALKLIKLGLPLRVTYARIWATFGSVLDGVSSPTNINFRDFAEAVLLTLGAGRLASTDYELGLNMVFFRRGKQLIVHNILATDTASVASTRLKSVPFVPP